MLSELEYVTLGVLRLEQPCTAYAVRMVFQQSLSSHWSGSAGAIYPLLRKLEKQKLVRSTARRGDGRSTRLYALTRRGETELQQWLRPPLPPAEALITIDPLRLRGRFLEAVSEAERAAFARDAETKLRALLARINELARADKRRGDQYRYLTNRSAALGIRAQLAWLKEVNNVMNDSKT